MLSRLSFVQNLQKQLVQPISFKYFCKEANVVNEWRKPSWDVRMLYDGECPLCMHEVNFLKNRDNGKNKIDFVDISSPNYSSANNQGVSYEQGMGRIHGILQDGTVIRDIEVFRKCYSAVGLGWIFAATENKYVEQIANSVYGFWAKYRMQITGRPGLEVVFEKRRTQGQMCRKEE
eukprot:TRINITY_DN51547_c0_g1_i1.p2 TRINITY_DN51547_c0_g1~~TRINITY_DN51547_c0_g1_i1.p2  ORF type:complete len:176 (-),score=22.81 TRINITY_DN51547_c0_g1_i1:329-856(-)